MKEELKTGTPVTVGEILKVAKALTGAKQLSELNGTAEFKLKESGADQILKKYKALNDAVREYQSLVSQKKTAGSKVNTYFGSEEKMINNLKQAYNEYVKDVQNGKVDFGKLQDSSSAKSVLRNANALDAMIKIDPDNSSALQQFREQNEEIFSLVEKMRSIPLFYEGAYNADIGSFVQAFTPVINVLNEVDNALSHFGMTSEESIAILKYLNFDKFDKIENPVRDLLKLQKPESSTTNYADEYEEEASRMEEAAKKYVKATEEMMEAQLNARHKKSNVDGEDVWGYEENDEKSISRIQEKLKELQEDRERALSMATYYNNRLAEGGTTTSWGGDIEEELNNQIKKYHEASDQIEYVQKELTEATMNFKPGDSWGTDEISALISLLQELQRQIISISESFSQIGDNDTFGSIVQSLQNINDIFNTEKIEAFNTQLSEMLMRLNEIANKNFENKIEISPPSNDSAGNIKEEELFLQKEYARYKNAYDKIMKVSEKHAKKYSGGTGQEYLFGQMLNSNRILEQFGGFDELNSHFSNTAIEDEKSIKRRIEMLQRFFSYIRELRSGETGDSDFWKRISTINLPSSDPTRIRKAIEKIYKEPTEQGIEQDELDEQLKNIIPKESFADSESFKELYSIIQRIKEVLDNGISNESFTALSSSVSTLIEQFSELNRIVTEFKETFNLKDTIPSDALDGITNILKEGFGLGKDNGELSYFEQLISAMKEVIEVRKQLLDAGISDDKTGEAASIAAEGIREEGQAAQEASAKKIMMTEANEQLANSGRATSDAIKLAANAVEEEGNVAANAATQKEKMAEANEKLADSGKKSEEKTKKENNSSDGKKSSRKSSKNKDDSEYDDEKMKSQAKSIRDRVDQMSSSFEEQGLITSIKEMYDSHNNLVEAIITTKKQIQTDDGRLAEQIEHYNIHWDERGDELYSSRMQQTDYEKYHGASDQDALKDAIKRAEEDQQREAEYLAERKRLIEEGKRQAEEIAQQEKEEASNTKQWNKMEKEYQERKQQEAKEREERIKADAKADEERVSNNQKIYDDYIKNQQKDRSKEKNDTQKKYNEQLKKIQEFGSANTENLNLKNRQLKGEDVTQQMADSLDNVTKKAQEAKEAMKELLSMRKNGEISQEDFNKARDLYKSENIQQGSATARDNAKKVKSKIESTQSSTQFKQDLQILKDYIKAQTDLDDLRAKSVKGNLTDEESTRKAKLEEEVKNIDEVTAAYNRLKKSKEDALVTDKMFNDNKVDSLYTTATQGASDKTQKSIDSLFSQTEKRLSKASLSDKSLKLGGWRPTGWADEMDRLSRSLQDIKNEAKSIDFSRPDAASDFEKIRQKIQEVNAAYTNLSKSDEWKPIDATWGDSFTTKIAKWMEQNKIAAKAFREELDGIRDAIGDVDNAAAASDLENQFSKIQTMAADQRLLGKSLGDRFRDQFKNTMTSLATYYLSFQDFVRYGREAIQTVTELDTAMTELKKVSDESEQSYGNFLKNSFDMADEVGTTSEQIIQSTADWKRLGKSFDESQKLAQQSTMLMNVSEFTSIQDATDAMVSATQAYTDVASEDIIDKLNYVGNNFAVGTSDLASGLQNAAAVLKTQGNDIDEALALLTTGNLIGQDMSKASAGIRTISLRISGTEEAKNEIAEMGEDVDDFVVRTKSKTDQIIRDYTAVASNNYQGVSVLDPNGNLRDTYDILLDISKIYKEIQEEDKQYGTNRAQALVEQLAGKNRSNIASSILLNGDILEDVYNASKNESANSAQKELNTYLDSIEGRTAKLQNRLQELTSSAIDSEFIKAVIDGLTHILELANSIVDTFGTLPTLLGAIGGFFMQKNGLGKHNSFPESQLVNKMPFLLQRIIMPCVCK